MPHALVPRFGTTTIGDFTGHGYHLSAAFQALSRERGARAYLSRSLSSRGAPSTRRLKSSEPPRLPPAPGGLGFRNNGRAASWPRRTSALGRVRNEGNETSPSCPPGRNT